MKSLKIFVQSLRKAWMAFAHILGVVQTTILLTLVYVFFIGAANIIARLLGKDLLRHRMLKAGSFWQPKAPVAHTLEQSRHQF